MTQKPSSRLTAILQEDSERATAQKRAVEQQLADSRAQRNNEAAEYERWINRGMPQLEEAIVAANPDLIKSGRQPMKFSRIANGVLSVLIPVVARQIPAISANVSVQQGNVNVAVLKRTAEGSLPGPTIEPRAFNDLDPVDLIADMIEAAIEVEKTNPIKAT